MCRPSIRPQEMGQGKRMDRENVSDAAISAPRVHDVIADLTLGGFEGYCDIGGPPSAAGKPKRGPGTLEVAPCVLASRASLRKCAGAGRVRLDPKGAGGSASHLIWELADHADSGGQQGLGTLQHPREDCSSASRDSRSITSTAARTSSSSKCEEKPLTQATCLRSTSS